MISSMEASSKSLFFVADNDLKTVYFLTKESRVIRILYIYTQLCLVIFCVVDIMLIHAVFAPL